MAKGKKTGGRDWVKGESGNPSGRPVTKPITDAYKKILALPPEEIAAYVPTTGFERLAYSTILMAAGRGPVGAGSAPVSPLSATVEITGRIEGGIPKAPEDREDEKVSDEAKLALLREWWAKRK